MEALDLGADDYVTKPFAMNELMARLRAAVRRAPGAEPTETEVVAGDLVIDLARKRVRRDGVDVRLTPTEWALPRAARPQPRAAGRRASRSSRGLGHRRTTHETTTCGCTPPSCAASSRTTPARPRHLLTSSGAGLHPRAVSRAPLSVRC